MTSPEGNNLSGDTNPITGKAPETDAPILGTWLNRGILGMRLASFFSDAGHETATSIFSLASSSPDCGLQSTPRLVLLMPQRCSCSARSSSTP